MKGDRKPFLLSIAIGLLLAACNTESQLKEPVTTTTDKGASTAAPAKEAEKRDKALVRVVHAIPGGAAVDAFVGGTKEFPNVAYKTVTPYKEVPDAYEQFVIKPAGRDSAQPLAQNSEGISGGNHYTAIGMPTADGKTTLRVIADKITPPAAGKASVRIIHASPDTDEVDVFVKGTNKELFDSVDFQTVTNYNEIDPMTVSLEVRPEGKNDVLLNLQNVTFDAGHLYTIIVSGKSKGAPKLEVIKIDDQIGAYASPSPNPNTAMNR
jgi:hypothetical protein